jgi:hypothetical protein
MTDKIRAAFDYHIDKALDPSVDLPRRLMHLEFIAMLARVLAIDIDRKGV